MKEKATIFDYARMCKTYATLGCHYCPLSHCKNGSRQDCGDFIKDFPDKANEIILNWCKEHPAETRQDRFLKMFPNAKIDNCGTSILCPLWVDKDFKCNRQLLCCTECCKEYWLAEVEKNDK